MSVAVEGRANPSSFDVLPHVPTVTVAPYVVDFPQVDIDDLKHRLETAPPRRKTWENSASDEQLGVTREWLEEAIEAWKAFDCLVGYGFSSPPAVDIDFATGDNAALFDVLMRGMGFHKYIAQGGDVASLVARFLGHYDACQAVHVNMLDADQSEDKVGDVDVSQLDSFDRECLERWRWFNKWEFAYFHDYATKTATIGFVLEASPVALLAWIGEKLLMWSDDPSPPLSMILVNVSLYWLTTTITTSLYHYRVSYGKRATDFARAPPLKHKPVGYSLFKKEIQPILRPWAETQVDLVWFRRHDRGGQFAALEQPEVYWQDVREFCEEVWRE